MGLKMKNFNTLGFHWKIQLLGDGEFMKNRYRGMDCLKRGAWQERGGGVFEGGWYSNAHYAPVAQTKVKISAKKKFLKVCYVNI